MVRLGEVAEVRLAAEDVRSIARSNGLPGVSLGITPTSKANVLDVSKAVRAEVARMQPSLPKDIQMEVNLDFTVSVVESMRKVVTVLVETLLIVLVVIFVFLGTWRATLIPAVTIPVSIMAGAMVMAALGYSINTLTLLGAVLAIGLVVDDAIVVLENIARRIEGGEPSLLAAMNGSREIGFAVIATTLVLMAVFVPVSYMPGTLGRLFGEFGVTVAAAVGFSALVALTLTPMMASKLFEGGIHRGRAARWLDGVFQAHGRGLRARAARRDAAAPAAGDRARRRLGHGPAGGADGGRLAAVVHEAAAGIRAARGSRDDAGAWSTPPRARASPTSTATCGRSRRSCSTSSRPAMRCA